MIQLLFGAVQMVGRSSTPVLVLQEQDGSRSLAVWISAGAAAAILSAIEAESLDHPSTHDLLLEALATQSAVVESVTILSVADGVYDAQLTVNGTAVTCRVSDGVALALRSGAPILAPEELMAEHGIASEPVIEEPGQEDAETQEVRQFREFLANVRADDFDKPAR